MRCAKFDVATDRKNGVTREGIVSSLCGGNEVTVTSH